MTTFNPSEQVKLAQAHFASIASTLVATDPTSDLRNTVLQLAADLQSLSSIYTGLAALPSPDNNKPPPDLVSLKQHVVVHQALECMVAWGLAPALMQLSVWPSSSAISATTWHRMRDPSPSLKLSPQTLHLGISKLNQQATGDVRGEQQTDSNQPDTDDNHDQPDTDDQPGDNHDQPDADDNPHQPNNHNRRHTLVVQACADAIVGIMQTATFSVYVVQRYLPDAIAALASLNLVAQPTAGKSLWETFHQLEVNPSGPVGSLFSADALNGFPLTLRVGSCLQALRFHGALRHHAQGHTNNPDLGKSYARLLGGELSWLTMQRGGVATVLSEMLSNVPEGNVGAYVHVASLLATPPSVEASQAKQVESVYLKNVCAQLLAMYRQLVPCGVQQDQQPHEHRFRLRRAMSLIVNHLAKRAQHAKSLRDVLHQDFLDTLVGVFPRSQQVSDAPSIRQKIHWFRALVDDSPMTVPLEQLLNPYVLQLFTVFQFASQVQASERGECQEAILKYLAQAPRQAGLDTLVASISPSTLVCDGLAKLRHTPAVAEVDAPRTTAKELVVLQRWTDSATEGPVEYVLRWADQSGALAVVQRACDDIKGDTSRARPGDGDDTELVLPSSKVLLPSSIPARPKRSVHITQMGENDMHIPHMDESDMIPPDDSDEQEDRPDTAMECAKVILQKWEPRGEASNRAVALLVTLLRSVSQSLGVDHDVRDPQASHRLQRQILFLMFVNMEFGVEQGIASEPLVEGLSELLSTCVECLQLDAYGGASKAGDTDQDAAGSAELRSERLLVAVELLPTSVALVAAIVDRENEDQRQRHAAGNGGANNDWLRKHQLLKPFIQPLSVLSHLDPTHYAAMLCARLKARMPGDQDPRALASLGEHLANTLSDVSEIAIAVRMSIFTETQMSGNVTESPTSAGSGVVNADAASTDVGVDSVTSGGADATYDDADVISLDPVGDKIGQWIKGLKGSEPHVRAMAVDELRWIIRPKRARGISLVQRNQLNVSKAHVERVIRALIEQLYDADSYVFLTSIRAIADCVDVHTELLLPELIRVFAALDPELGTDAHLGCRLRIGEVMMLASRRCGDMLPKYVPQLVPVLLQGASIRQRQIGVAKGTATYDATTGKYTPSVASSVEDNEPTTQSKFSRAMLRSSCLSNLAFVCSVAPRACLNHALDIVSLAQGVLLLEAADVGGEVERDAQMNVKRGAAFLLEKFMGGLRMLDAESEDESTLVLAPQEIRDVYRLLKDVNSSPQCKNDGVVQAHCDVAYSHISVVMRRFMFPEKKKVLKVSLGLERL